MKSLRGNLHRVIDKHVEYVGVKLTIQRAKSTQQSLMVVLFYS